MNNLEEYRRIRKNLLEKIRYYEKQGIYTNIKIPKKPQKITEKSIKRLKDISTEKIKGNAIYIDTETGEEITSKSYTEKRKNQQKNKKNKKEKTGIGDIIEYVPTWRIYEQNYKNYITQFSRQGKEILECWLKEQSEKYGKKGLYSQLSLMASKGLGITEEELMYSDTGFEQLFSKLDEMADFMKLEGSEREIFSLPYDESGAVLYDSEGEELF